APIECSRIFVLRVTISWRCIALSDVLGNEGSPRPTPQRTGPGSRTLFASGSSPRAPQSGRVGAYRAYGRGPGYRASTEHLTPFRAAWDPNNVRVFAIRLLIARA